MESHGKSWKDHEKSSKVMKSHKKSWKDHGKIMESHQKIIKSHGNHFVNVHEPSEQGVVLITVLQYVLGFSEKFWGS